MMHVTLPSDLAELLIEDGRASEAPPDMAAPPGLLEDATTVAMTLITLAQGPLTLIQIREYLRRWIERRRERGDKVGELRLRHRSGKISLFLSPNSDLEAIGAALRDLLNAQDGHSRHAPEWDDESEW